MRSKPAGMNHQLGTVWFTIYTKIRPFIVWFLSLETIVDFIQYPREYFTNILVLVSFAAGVVHLVLCAMVFTKSKDHYSEFVRFVNGVLVFETIMPAYNVGLEIYYKEGFSFVEVLACAGIMLVLAYLIWYQLNIKYFRKRLMPVAVTGSNPQMGDNSQAPEQTPPCQVTYPPASENYVYSNENTYDDISREPQQPESKAKSKMNNSVIITLAIVIAFVLGLSIALNVFLLVQKPTTSQPTEAVPPLLTTNGAPLLTDAADLLAEEESASLEQKLTEISTRQGMDIVIVTVDSTEGAATKDFARDWYYNHDYQPDCILLLVSMDDHETYIFTSNFDVTAIPDASIDYVFDQFISYLSDGDYAQGFDIFVDVCDSYITQARSSDSTSPTQAAAPHSTTSTQQPTDPLQSEPKPTNPPQPTSTTCLELTCKNVVIQNGQYCAEHACTNSSCSFKKDYNSQYCSVCQCQNVGCKNLKIPSGYYCEEHTCKATGCTSENQYSSDFCITHKCNSCNNMKTANGSYCVEHTCARSGCATNKQYGSEFCMSHTCLAGICKDLQVDGGQYCEEHTCIVPGCNKQKHLADYCYSHAP